MYKPFVVSRAFMAGRLAMQETLNPPGHLISPLVAGVRDCPPWCSIVGATVTVHQFFFILHFCHTCSLCCVELVVQFPARGSTQVLLCLSPGALWLWHFLYSVGPHPVSSLHIYPLTLLCRGHWVRLAKQEILTSPGHLVSPLVCRGLWMSTVVLYYWCHSDSASVPLYFTLWTKNIWHYYYSKQFHLPPQRFGDLRWE